MKEFTLQQKQALQYKSHSIVSANAGSGKTRVFSTRFVNIALGIALNEKDEIVKVEGTPPDIQKLIAITYTDKAASELYTKIVEEISNRIKAESDEELLNRLYRLRREIISANISTIHSFCMRLLKKFPVKANLDPNFIPIDTRVSDELIEESFIELCESHISEDIKYLVRVFGGKDLLKDALETAIEKRADIAELDSLYSKNEDEIKKFFSDKYCELRDRIISKEKIEWFFNTISIINETALRVVPKKNKGYENALLMKDFIRSADNNFNGLSIFIRKCQETELLNSSMQLHGSKYLTGRVRDELGTEPSKIAVFLSDAVCFLLSSEEEKDASEFGLAVFGKKFIVVFNELNKIYSRKKEENGFLDFEDLLLKARDLIRDESVCNDLKKEIDYIMIDEYQDTNQLQYDLFLPILSELNSKLQRGNLFVVGDEKQSIYMFRNADLKIYNDTNKDITNNKGREIILPHSFRMTYNNCLFTNKLFENLFYSCITEDIRLYNEVKNTSLICGIGKEKNGNVEFGFHDLKIEDYSEEDLVSGRIIELVNEKIYEFKNIAVLCRKKDSFPHLEKAFVKYGIPYLIIGGQGFYYSQVVKDFYNYLAFLLNNEDDIALTGILRSPFFSLSDASLYEISLNGYSGLWSKIKSYSGDGALKSEIESIKNILEENIEFAKGNSPAFIIRKILCDSPYFGVVSLKENGIQDSANIEKLVNIAHNFVSGGLTSLYDFVDFLKDSIENNPDENQASVVSDQNCVKIMTVHQSKGLEFPAVFLFQSHAVTQKTTTKSKSINISKDYGFLTKIPQESLFKNYLTPPICSGVDFIQKKRESAEIKRLLYVAVTRAAEFLFISSSYKETKKGEINFDENSFTGLIEKGLFPGGGFKDILSLPSFFLTGEITYKVTKGKEDLATDKNITLTIPVRTNITAEKYIQEEGKFQFELMLDSDEDYTPSGEVLTASRYADYTNSPQDYFNKYVLDLEKNSYSAVSGKRKQGALIGSVVHSLLSNNYPVTKEKIVEIIGEEAGSGIIENTDELSEKICSEVSAFTSSDVYRSLNSYSNYKNEYELWFYNKEEKFFMHGIIDKVVFCDDMVYIIDYKTNNVKENELCDLAESYKPQLNFYAVLLSKAYPEFKRIELKLLFTKFPEKNFTWQVSNKELMSEENNIIKMSREIKQLVN